MSEWWDLRRGQLGAILFLFCCVAAFVLLAFDATDSMPWLVPPVALALWMYEGGDD